jgi:hypothetical protein
MKLNEDAGVKVSAVKVAPEHAVEMLSAMTDQQRKPNQSRVNEYAKEMTLGNWRVSNDALIEIGGKYYNGQHRLLALIKSQTTQTFLLLRATDPALMRVIDGGKPRSIGDALQVEGLAGYSKAIVSMGVLALAYERKLLTCGGSNMSDAGGGRVSEKKLCTRQEKIEYCLRHQKALRNIATEVHRLYENSGQILPCSTAGALWFIIAKKDGEDKAREFIEGVSTGDGITPAQKAYRVSLIRDLTMRRKMSAVVRFAIGLKAYISHRNGTTPAKLSVKVTEDFPTI